MTVRALLLVAALLAGACTSPPGGVAEPARSAADTPPTGTATSAPPPAPGPAPPSARPSPTPTPPPPPPVLSDTPVLPCPGVLMVGARGSGQPDGLGPGLDMLVAAVAFRLDTDVAQVAVAYPASPVATAMLDRTAFDAAIRTGTTQLLHLTATQVRACPATAVVWAGFSQGALVLRAGMDRAGDPDSAGVQAVVLLADPRRAAHDPVDRGPADPATGAPDRFDPVAVPAVWSPVTTSWCATEDPICTDAASQPVTGLLQHAGGYAGLSLIADAAADLAARLTD